MKKILYVDMDDVLVDFESAYSKIDQDTLERFNGSFDEMPGIFALMDPKKDAIPSFNILAEKFDIFVLSTAPWNNPSAWTDKALWVKKHLGDKAYKRLILSHRKDLNIGHYLIDDKTKNGAGDFKGELILFGSEKFKDWKTVVEYLMKK